MHITTPGARSSALVSKVHTRALRALASAGASAPSRCASRLVGAVLAAVVGGGRVVALVAREEERAGRVVELLELVLDAAAAAAALARSV